LTSPAAAPITPPGSQVTLAGNARRQHGDRPISDKVKAGARATLSHRLEYFGYRLAAGLLSALPVEAASNLGGAVWRALAPFDRRHRRALENLRLAFPDSTPQWRERVARDMWEGLGRVFAEGFHLQEIVAEGRVALTPDSIAAMPADRRFVAAAPHQANWEVAAAVLRASGGRAGGIYQRLKNPLVDAHVRSLRAPFYPGGLWPKQGDAGRQALRHLRAGGVFATMGDLRDASGPLIPFFGRPAPSSIFPALAARSVDAPLLAVEIVREPGVRFTVRLARVETPRTHDRDADARAGAAALQAAFEASIRRRPEQWMWNSRRWG
jgi:KDO2-lipid IV(A) lauroyltransferase